MINYDTWLKHHLEDLPHIKFAAEVALLQDDLNRYYLREQPRGTWVDQIPPWTDVVKRGNTHKVTMDQCTTGLRDSQAVLIRKPTEMMSNNKHPETI